MKTQTRIAKLATTTTKNKINYLILIWVVMSLENVHGANNIDTGLGASVATNSGLPNGSEGKLNGHGSGSEQKYKTQSFDNNLTTRQVNSLLFVPQFEQVAAEKRASSAAKWGAGGIDRDDDHSNIELERLEENNRYSLVSKDLNGGGVGVWPNNWSSNINNNNNNAVLNSIEKNNDINNDPYNFERLFGRIILNNHNSPSLSASKLNEYVKNQLERKRSIRALQNREDKEYNFIVQPYQQQSQQPHLMLLNRFYTNPQQYEQSSNKWMARKLRDMKLSDGNNARDGNGYQASASNFRDAPLLDSDITDNRNSYLDQLSQVNSRLFNNGVERFPYNNNNNNNNAINSENLPDSGMANSREKRRRCKMDPNLGVKNPSFCDTDAYFGAADYSMRDVWDSAGR